MMLLKKKAPERIGVEPEAATQIAAETGVSAERAEANVALDVAAETAKTEIAAETGNETAERQKDQAELKAALDELKGLDIETLAQEFFKNYNEKIRTDPEGARAFQTEFLKRMERLKNASNARFKELMTNPDEQILADEAASVTGYTRLGRVSNRMFEEGTSFDAKWQTMNKRVEELQDEARKSGR